MKEQYFMNILKQTAKKTVITKIIIKKNVFCTQYKQYLKGYLKMAYLKMLSRFFKLHNNVKCNFCGFIDIIYILKRNANLFCFM